MTASLLRLFEDLPDCFARPGKPCYRSLLALIVLVGLALRLAAVCYAQGYHHFMINDEVNALRYVLAWLAGDEQARYLAQPAFNNGNLPGPLWTLFGVALFKLGGGTAEGTLYAMAVVNSLIVLPVYLLARQLLEPSMALLTAAIYALAPWTIYYSYSLYNPVPLDLIGVLLFLALWQSLSQPRTRHVFWVPFWCAVIPQFHMIGLFVFPAVLLVLLSTWRTLNWRWLGLGIVAGILLYVPYLAGDMQNNWSNLQAMASGGEAREYSASVLKIITAPATVLSSVPAGWTGDGIEPIRSFAGQWFGHLAVLVILAGWTLGHSFIFLFYLLRRTGKELWRQRFNPAGLLQADRPGGFIGLLVVVPLLLFLLTGHNFSTRYAIVLFPLLFLLPGLFLQQRSRPGVKNYWAIALVLTGVFNFYLLGSYYAHQQQRFAGGETFMPSFRVLENIRQTLQADAGKQTPFEVVVSPHLQQTLSSFEYKLVYTIHQYTDNWQTYRQDRQGVAAVTYEITDNNKHPSTSGVYDHNGILIRRKETRGKP